MATFNELLTILRRDVLGEDASASQAGGFDDTTELLPMLYRSARELGQYFEVPVVIANTATLTSTATNFTLPGDVAKVKEVFIKNSKLTKKPYSYILRVRNRTDRPSYYHWNYLRDNPTTIEFAPSFSGTASAGDVVVEYVQSLATATYTTSSVPWAGELPDWHWLVAYRAGVHAWLSVGRSDEASVANAAFQEGVQALAARLNLTNVPRSLVPPQARSDEGVRNEP